MNYTNELYHFGIKGQRWGIRRFQNEDGTLTDEGQRRYGVSGEGERARDLRSLLKDRRERQERENALLEPGKNIHEVSDRALDKRREKISQIQKAQRVQSILQAALGVSLLAIGEHTRRTSSSMMGTLLKRFGAGYLLGTGAGMVVSEAASGFAKRAIDKEKEGRLMSRSMR